MKSKRNLSKPRLSEVMPEDFLPPVQPYFPVRCYFVSFHFISVQNFKIICWPLVSQEVQAEASSCDFYFSCLAAMQSGLGSTQHREGSKNCRNMRRLLLSQVSGGVQLTGLEAKQKTENDAQCG